MASSSCNPETLIGCCNASLNRHQELNRDAEATAVVIAEDVTAENMEYETAGPDLLEPGMVLQDRYRIVQRLAEGGFGQIFEVDDNGTTKILKVLLCNYPKAVELFQQEVKILKQLDSPGIPRVDADSYFYHQSEDGEIRHCLVMEKISGINLQQWMQLRENQPIEEALAIDWLRQLAQLLDYIHQHRCFHRDIKPSNIILKPDGQLALIDFGAVRQITESYLASLQADRTGTRLQSRGYTPFEQIEGRAVLQSDFFALGRTMVHLVTGIAPSNLPIDLKTGQLIWQEWGSTLSPQFSAVIDMLMAPFPGQRPQTAQEILQRLDRLSEDAIASLAPSPEAPIASLPTEVPPEQSRFGRATQALQQGLMRWGGVPLALLWSVVATAGVMGLRWTGNLQALELMAFDQMMQLRPAEAMDDRLLIVEIAQEDVAQLDRYPLEDAVLLQLLKKLDAHNPAAIGIDIFRDRPEGKGRAELVQYLQASDRIIAPCVHPYDGVPQGIAPPPKLQPIQVGFIDVPVDDNKVARRQLLAMQPFEDSLCPANSSLSFQLAKRYLGKKDIPLKRIDARRFQVGGQQIARLSALTGFYYHRQRMEGDQILLNYRRVENSPSKLAQRITLTHALTQPLTAELVRGRVILIGVTAPTIKDDFVSPYNQGIRGLLLHAQMTSQLLSSAEDGRNLLYFWPLWSDILWILSWAVVGACLTRLRFAWGLLAATIVAVALYGLCFMLFWLEGLLVPLVPAAFALMVAFVGMRASTQLTLSLPVTELS